MLTLLSELAFLFMSSPPLSPLFWSTPLWKTPSSGLCWRPERSPRARIVLPLSTGSFRNPFRVSLQTRLEKEKKTLTLKDESKIHSPLWCTVSHMRFSFSILDQTFSKYSFADRPLILGEGGGDFKETNVILLKDEHSTSTVLYKDILAGCGKYMLGY